MDRDCFIKQFFIDAVSPPEKSFCQLFFLHPKHESTYNQCLSTSVEDHDMIFFHSRNNLSFYTICKISCLKKEARFWKYTFIYFFECFICLHKISENRSIFPRGNSDFPTFCLEHLFESFYLGRLSRSIWTFEYDQSSRECMAVTDIWTHNIHSEIKNVKSKDSLFF